MASRPGDGRGDGARSLGRTDAFRIVDTGSEPGGGTLSDVVTLGIAERRILEVRYPFPGRYMFHPHQDQIAERGCMGLFEVLPA